MLNQLRDSTQQKMRNILFLSLEILEKELIKENSSVNINLALKIVQNYKITNLIDNKKCKVGIIGLGYVGLPLAILFVKNNFKILGLFIM